MIEIDKSLLKKNKKKNTPNSIYKEIQKMINLGPITKKYM